MTSSRPARGYVLPPYGKATPRGRIVLDRHVEAAKIVGQPITKAVLPHPEASNFHLRACACNWLDRHVAGPRPVRNGHQRLLRQRKLGRDRAHSDRLTAADTRAGNLSNACRAQGLLSALQVRICGAHLVLRQGHAHVCVAVQELNGNKAAELCRVSPLMQRKWQPCWQHQGGLQSVISLRGTENAHQSPLPHAVCAPEPRALSGKSRLCRSGVPWVQGCTAGRAGGGVYHPSSESHRTSCVVLGRSPAPVLENPLPGHVSGWVQRSAHGTASGSQAHGQPRLKRAPGVSPPKSKCRSHSSAH